MLLLSKVNNVCIVGGGSAGWLTAFILKNRCSDLDVTIVESDIANIGVGESTQPNLIVELLRCGLRLKDIIEHTDATYKIGIYYEDWDTLDSNYWHPFTSRDSNKEVDGVWLESHGHLMFEDSSADDYVSSYNSKYHLASWVDSVQNNKARVGPYALHIDADKLASFLRMVSPEFGINLVNKRVEREDINIQDEKITSIDGLGSFDFYVDCTGTHKILRGLFDYEYTDYDKKVTHAVAARIEYPEHLKKELMFPYTKAHAQENGWIWTIPLYSRIGSGYVFNINYTSEDEAKEHLVAYWKERGITSEFDTKVLKIPQGAMTEPFKSNVCAIGMGAGFIEPLEATGIAWTINSAVELSSILRNRYIDDVSRNLYNSNMLHFSKDVEDFVDVHYLLSKRTDSKFWRDIKDKKPCDRLSSRLDTYSKYTPSLHNRNSTTTWAFNEVSWSDVLVGHRFKFKVKDKNPRLHNIPRSPYYSDTGFHNVDLRMETNLNKMERIFSNG